MPPHFPRSEKYDGAWVEKNSMGPNTLWLMESLCERVELEQGMRVLDLGCGRAISSIFLAREFDVQVWATDLWIHPSENWPRIRSTESVPAPCMLTSTSKLRFLRSCVNARIRNHLRTTLEETAVARSARRRGIVFPANAGRS